MITTFCQHGNYQNRARARTRFMQETLGPDELRRVFLENVAAAKADESLKLHLTPAAITKTGHRARWMTRAPLPKNSRGCTLWRTTPSAAA